MTMNSTDRVAVSAIIVAGVALALQLYSFQLGIPENRRALSTSATLDNVKKSGQFIAGVVPAPPISSIDPRTGEAQGYAVDVVRQIAERSQLKVQFVPSDWATMGAALSSKKVDIIVGPVFFSEGRAKDFLFSDPLLAYAIVAVVPTSQSSKFRRDDLGRAGLRVSVGRGGFDAEFVVKYMPNANIKFFPPDDPNLPLLEVASGRADVAIADFATARKYAAEHPSVSILFSDDPLSIQFAGFMLRGEDEPWVRYLNLVLRNMVIAGDLKKIEHTYESNRTWYGTVSTGWTLVKQP